MCNVFKASYHWKNVYIISGHQKKKMRWFFFLKAWYYKELWPTYFWSLNNPAFHTWSWEHKKCHTELYPWLIIFSSSFFLWQWYLEEAPRENKATLHITKLKHSGRYTNNIVLLLLDTARVHHSLICASPSWIMFHF